ncbi:hypothetical protein OIU85_003609 [Salix viminalis]|uniref:Uncharacterized protein n=1 Tax=Salix viminalis TaxID=40686 RepID=A0A9Q0PZJ6_SALVM|nr:hypothetical protein OIU85_003609 [Salix viminalis]
MAITGATFAASAQLRSSRCPASTPLRSGIRRDEIKQLARRLQQVSRNGFSKVELRSMFTDLTFNIVMRMIAGKRYYGEDVNLIEETNTFKETMKEYADLGGLTNLADVFPIIQRVDYNGFVRKCVGLGKRMDLILQGLIDEHRRDKDRNTMINHLLTLQDSQPDQYYTEDIIKGLVLVSGLSFHLLVLVHRRQYLIEFLSSFADNVACGDKDP